MKRIVMFIYVLILFSYLFAAGQEDMTQELVTLEQADGTILTLESYPRRVISLGPNITETIFALDRGNLLVGRTDFCDFPAEVNSIESVGTLREPSLEKIVLLEPDLVIASTHAQPAVMDRINSLDIPVLQLYSDDSFEGVYKLISQTGKALNAAGESEDLVKSMKDRVADVIEFVKNKEKPLVYYVIGYGEFGDYTAGGNTFIGQMINMAGAVNAAEELEGWRFSLEELVNKNPDIIVCSQYWNSREGIINTSGYKELPAVKEGRIFTIDNNKLDRQGPRLAEALEDLAEIFHGPMD